MRPVLAATVLLTPLAGCSTAAGGAVSARTASAAGAPVAEVNAATAVAAEVYAARPDAGGRG